MADKVLDTPYVLERGHLYQRNEILNADLDLLEHKADYYYAALRRIAVEVAQARDRGNLTQIEVILRRMAGTKELEEILNS